MALQRGGANFHSVVSYQIFRYVTAGEPINPEAWKWYHGVVGDGRCPIADTWWQTETGAHMIAPLPGAVPLKPGSATLPFFGTRPTLSAAPGLRASCSHCACAGAECYGRCP